MLIFITLDVVAAEDLEFPVEGGANPIDRGASVRCNDVLDKNMAK